MAPGGHERERRVLVLAPNEKDAALTQRLLTEAHLPCVLCRDLDCLAEEIEQGAGATVLTEQDPNSAAFPQLLAVLKRQPPWSELPFVVLTAGGADAAVGTHALEALGNVIRLEQPVRIATLVSALQMALRSRERQYQVRDLLEVREQTTARERAAHDTFRRLVENSPFGIYVVDADFRLVQVSAGAQKVFENVRPLLGRDFAEVLRTVWPEPFASEAIGHFRHTLETGEPYHAPRTIERREDIGEVQSYDWKIERVTLPDGRFGTVCHFYDLSERQQYEEALKEADRRKDEFLAMLAHELRNPLAPLSNALELLKQTYPDPPQLERLRAMMARQVSQLRHLVDDLLEVSRITQGKIQLRPEPVELSQVVARSIEALRPLIESQGHELTVVLPPEPVWLEVDPVRLEQVLGNLLNNAAKFTEPGGHLWLQAAVSGGEVTLRVKDTGMGIAPEVLPGIFDLFTQADRSLDRSQGGLGIGLSLVKHLVEMHEGRIEAFSEGAGKGSEFVIHLPVVEAPSDAQELALASNARTRCHSSRRVLVVDDNRDSAETIALILEEWEHEVRCAHDGPAAVAVARDYRPEVVLLDIGLPGMDGYEVARALRREPELAETIVIAMTGYGQEEDVRRSKQAGFNEHLVKPVDLQALERVLADGFPPADRQSHYT